jgi:hypothetical protein
MANNAGRQGGGGNGQMNEHVEFTVKVSFCFVEASGLGVLVVRKFPVGFETKRRKSMEYVGTVMGLSVWRCFVSACCFLIPLLFLLLQECIL